MNKLNTNSIVIKMLIFSLFIIYTLGMKGQSTFWFEQGSLSTQIGPSLIAFTENELVALNFEEEEHPAFYISFDQLVWDKKYSCKEPQLIIDSDKIKINGDTNSIRIDAGKFKLTKDRTSKIRIRALENGYINLRLYVEVIWKKSKKKTNRQFHIIEKHIKLHGISKEGVPTASKTNDLPVIPTVIPPVVTPIQRETPINSPPSFIIQQTREPIFKRTVSRPESISKSISDTKINTYPVVHLFELQKNDPAQEQSTRKEEDQQKSFFAESIVKTAVAAPQTINLEEAFNASLKNEAGHILIQINQGIAPYSIQVTSKNNLVVHKRQIFQECPPPLFLQTDSLMLANGEYLVSVKDARKNKTFELYHQITKGQTSNYRAILFSSSSYIIASLACILLMILSFLFNRFIKPTASKGEERFLPRTSRIVHE